MPDKIKILIIDDEAPARDLLKNYLSQVPDTELAGECENGFEAIKAIQESNPDLLLLDIQMPKINGFELLEVLDPCPEVIFTTAFDQYAIKAFERNAVDYLLKPFSRERFSQAIEKARQRINQAATTGNQAVNDLKQHLEDEKQVIDRVVTRLGSKIIVIPVDKIWYIEAQDDYVMVYSELGHHLKEKTMRYFNEHLPPGQFIQIHRSHIVAVTQIASIELYEKNTHLVILKCGTKLRSSQEGYRRLREML
jgi:two-component system LytT family response regulator